MFLITENGSGYVNSDKIEVIGLIENKKTGKIDVIAIKDANCDDESTINSYKLTSVDSIQAGQRYVSKLNRLMKGDMK